MVLLEEIWSGEGAPVCGKTENGEEIVLPVPNPCSFCGVGNYEIGLTNLKGKARQDSGNYYFINERPEIDSGFFSFAYVTFMK